MTPAQLAAFCPAAAPFYAALTAAFSRYDITTPVRQAAFLANCAQESGGFRRFVESLNYSATGLVATWPTRFYLPGPGEHDSAKRNAAEYARQPQKIAEAVYGNRMGNGPEGSGDGWLFIGRGFGVTGRANYAARSRSVYQDDRLVENPDLMAQPDAATLAAADQWHELHLSELADAGEFKLLCERWNGGLIGYDDGIRGNLNDRVDWHDAALKALGATS